ncbi:Pisatin demethylase [Colletotrichum spinosum]|uniref:Pisatin demethylase n=1 Tax=Colletotrichum spinosum TaxID=1347390 RepID=A0A4R8QFG6_9PEZI|nr:Pisatin demethylase [Colletotrichum spinosum]
MDSHTLKGPVVRIGPNRYSFNDAESLKIIYGHGTQFPKSDWYLTFQVDEKTWNTFTDRDIKRHAYNRRFYTNTYAMASLIHYEPYVNECGDIFSQRLLEFSKVGSAVDFGHWFQCFAFDAIAMMTYGKRLGFLDQGEDIANIIKNLDNNMRYSSLMGVFPSFHKYIMPLLTASDARLGKGNNMYVLNFTQRTIEEEQASPKSVAEAQLQEDGTPAGETFLSKFLAKHSNDPDMFTKYHILNGCAANIFAGSDTTGITLSATLYYLLKSPESMGKLREEIDDFTRRGELSAAPAFKETLQMPYLQAVIKEALRIHPAIGLPLERAVPEGGATICGKMFPEGTAVAINSWTQHRNKALFGEDADCFRPDRWLDSDKDRLSIMNRNWRVGADLEENLNLIELWRNREKDRQVERPRWTPNDESRYRVTITKLRILNDHDIQKLSQTHAEIVNLHESLGAKLELMRNDLEQRRAGDIQRFTMSEAPATRTLISMVVTAAVAFAVTVLVLTFTNISGFMGLLVWLRRKFGALRRWPEKRARSRDESDPEAGVADEG